MSSVLNLYKPLGKTPLETIEMFKEQNPQFKEIKLGYAGRLDPMAEGVLLVLAGDELKNQKKYWALDKEYEAEILLGTETDTFDILGMSKMSKFSIANYQFPNRSKSLKFNAEDSEQKEKQNFSFSSDVGIKRRAQIQKAIDEFQGEHTFEYPAYASRKVNGKPLFWWARRGKLSEIKIPTKTVQVHEIELLDIKTVTKEKLRNRILKNIGLVKGNFRQKQIKSAWKKDFQQTRADKFVVIKIRMFVSSGTYIRTIADELGKKLGTGAVLLHLKRTKVGDFNEQGSLKLTTDK
jgi:tRNA pseudouridine55 synthase